MAVLILLIVGLSFDVMFKRESLKVFGRMRHADLFHQIAFFWKLSRRAAGLSTSPGEYQGTNGTGQ